MICMTRMSPTATIISNAREYNESPTSTAASFPNSAFAVLRPRRSCESSTTSSCSRVAVWMNSTIAASSMWRSPAWSSARAASSTNSGRNRLPPPPMMPSAIWFTRATSEVRRARMVRLTAARSSPTSAWIEARSPNAGVGTAASMVGVIGGGLSGFEPSIAAKGRSGPGPSPCAASGVVRARGSEVVSRHRENLQSASLGKRAPRPERRPRKGNATEQDHVCGDSDGRQAVPRQGGGQPAGGAARRGRGGQDRARSGAPRRRR